MTLNTPTGVGWPCTPVDTEERASNVRHLTKRGTRVIIAPNNVDPVQIATSFPAGASRSKTAASSQRVFDSTPPRGKTSPQSHQLLPR